MNKSNQLVPVFLSTSILVLALSLSGCGKGVQKLTSDQKAEFKKTLASLGEAMQSASMGGMGAGQLGSGDPNAFGDGMSWGSKKSGRTGSHSKLQHELFESIQQNKCAVNSTAKSGQMSMASAGEAADIEISGNDCPIQFKMAVKHDNEWIQIQTAYKVRSEAYRALNDVDQVDAEIKMKKPQIDAKLDVSKRGASPQMQEIGMEYKLSFHSQKLGSIPLQMKMNMRPTRSSVTSAAKFPFTGELKLTASLPKYEVEVKATFEEKGPKYTLNQEDLSPEEFQEIMGSAQAGGPQGSNPFSPVGM